MNILETFKLSITAILSNRLRSGLTVLGIVIGVTSVILLVALVSGLKSFITDQISGLGSNIIFVIPGKIGGGRGPGGSQINKLTLLDATVLKNKLNGDADVSAATQKVTTTKYQNKSSKDTTIAGAQFNYPKIIQSIKVEEGRFFNSSEDSAGKRVAVVGPTLKRLLFNDNSPLGKSIEINNVKYLIVGVMSSRGSNFGIDLDNFAIIPLLAGQRQFGDDKVQNILVATKNPENVKAVQEKVKSILLKRLSEDDFTVQTSQQTLQAISQITNVLTIALGGIAAISLLVGGIGIMNIMLVSVTERTREIGLRKALGAKPHVIRNQFLIEALTLSGFGGILGILLGVLLSFIIGQFITTSVTWWSIALSFGFSVLVGIIFGVTPAIRAAKLNPIQALRYE